jgi:predicted peroxiredoxin
VPAEEDEMPDTSKVVINLATGLEDGERVTVAFLVGGAALERGKQVTMFLTKEAVRVALPGYADGTACDGCPSLARLLEQFAAAGGQLLVCPICFNARKLAESELAANARLGGATPLWEWIGDDHATVFSY